MRDNKMLPEILESENVFHPYTVSYLAPGIPEWYRYYKTMDHYACVQNLNRTVENVETRVLLV